MENRSLAQFFSSINTRSVGHFRLRLGKNILLLTCTTLAVLLAILTWRPPTGPKPGPQFRQHRVGDSTSKPAPLVSIRHKVNLQGSDGSTAAIAFDHTSTTVAAVDRQGDVFIWDIASGQTIGRRLRMEPRDRDLADSDPQIYFSVDDTKIIARYGGAISIWDTNNYEEVRTNLRPQYYRCLAPSKRDGQNLLVALSSTESSSIVGSTAVSFIDSSTGEEDRYIELQDSEGALGVACGCVIYTAESDTLTVISEPVPEISHWNLSDGTRVSESQPINAGQLNSEVAGLVCTDDGTVAVTYNNQGKGVFWDLSTGLSIGGISPDGEYYAGLNPKGEIVVVGSFTDTSLQLWNIASNSAMAVINIGPASPVIFDADSHLMATNSNRGIDIWQLS